MRWRGDEGAERTSKRAFRKRISSLHPHKEKYVIAGRQHYFGLLRGNARLGRLNNANSGRRCMRAAAGASMCVFKTPSAEASPFDETEAANR